MDKSQNATPLLRIANACIGAADAQPLFESPQVMKLVLAFTSITDEGTRRNVLSIVKMTATVQRGGEPAQT